MREAEAIRMEDTSSPSPSANPAGLDGRDRDCRDLGMRRRGRHVRFPRLQRVSSRELKKMNITISEFKHQGGETTTPHDAQRRSWDWRSIGAACSLSTGIIVLLLGSLLTVISWVLRAESGSAVKSVGTILLVLAIPLLICGAHCLDLMERQQDREKEKPFNEHE
jgi:hypothetical protein